MSSPPGLKAQIPNPSLGALNFLIGDWRTSGSHPMVPGKELPGLTSFAWHQGGAFLVMRSQVDEPQFPDGVAIIGSDDAAGTFAMAYFDERGTSRIMDVTVGEGTMTWRLISHGRMSRGGGPWEDDLSQTFVRIPSAEEQRTTGS